MKLRISVLILPVVAVALLAGCMSEPHESITISQGETKSITFALPGISRGPATYVDATGDENKLDYLRIYMFDGTTETLERVFDNDNIKVDKTGAKPTATIDVTERAGDKEFFFVANGENITSELGKARFGETTITQFLEMVSDKQANLLATPLLMSGRSTISAIENVDQADPADLEITLSRRVARFDIDNDASQTNFTITKILVGNVSKQTYVFADATGLPARTIIKENYVEIPFGTQSDANSANIAKSIFYTYPTTIGTGETEMSLVGTFRNEPTKERVFTIKPTTPIDILANKRYILKAKPITINEIDLDITVEDWEDASEHTAEPGENLFTITDLKVVTGGGTLTGNLDDGTAVYDVSRSYEKSIIRFSTYSFRSSGTSASIIFEKGDSTDLDVKINDPEVEITYGRARYEQHYEVEIPVKFTDNEVEIVVEIVNVYDPIQTVWFTITREGWIHYPISAGNFGRALLIDGIFFAPVNVGQTTMNSNTSVEADNGRLFQWGRSYYSCIYDGTPTNVNGPIDANTASTTYANHFIKGGSSYGYDWLSTQNDNLWKGDDRQGPCPEGWRVPTYDEMMKINTRIGAGKGTNQTHRIRVESDVPGEYLYIQSGYGYRDYNMSASYRNNYCLYWTSNTSGRNSQAVCAQYNTTAFTNWGSIQRASACLVRCVADMKVTP